MSQQFQSSPATSSKVPTKTSSAEERGRALERKKQQSTGTKSTSGSKKRKATPGPTDNAGGSDDDSGEETPLKYNQQFKSLLERFLKLPEIGEWKTPNSYSSFLPKDVVSEESEEYLLWATITSIQLVKKELKDLITDENDLLMARIANMLKADQETKPPAKGKTPKPPVPSKDNKPKLVPTNHPSNKPRDPTAIASLYQMENSTRLPPPKPTKPTKLQGKAKDPEKPQEQQTNPVFGVQLTKKDRRVTLVIGRDTPIPPREELDHASIIDRANNTIKAFQHSGTPLRFVTVFRNYRGNLILETPPNLPAQAYTKCLPDLKKTFPEWTIHNILVGSQWSFFRVDRVPVDKTITEIEGELQKNYPLLPQVQPPRWLLTASQRAAQNSRGEPKKFSSVIITIGTEMTTESLGLFSLGLFGQKCSLVNFYSAPLGAVCKHCFKGSHSIKHCSAEHRCGICADTHATANHKCNTPLCRGSYSCKHNLKCARCDKEGHSGLKCSTPPSPGPPLPPQSLSRTTPAQVPTLAPPKPRIELSSTATATDIEIEDPNF